MEKEIYIVGTGSYVPKNVINNEFFKQFIETSDEWIYTRTGIRERRWADRDEAASDLAAQAFNKMNKELKIDPLDIELIVMATITPDTQCPSGANWLEAKIGAKNAVSFDVTAACSGFIFALDVAKQYLLNGTFKNALVVASEIMSRVIDLYDRDSCILWGDAAGCVFLTTDEKYQGYPVLKSTHIFTDGENGQNLLMPGGGSKTTPISHESVDKKLHYLKLIQANDSLRVAVRRFSESIKVALKNNNLSPEDINVVIPHQANIRIIQNVAKLSKIPMEKFYLTIEKYANSSSSTVPTALDEAVRDGTIKKGDNVILTAFGGGLTWGSAYIKW